MLIDIFKHFDSSVFSNLKQYNQAIKDVSSHYKYNHGGIEYDLPNGVISRWFDPDFIKEMPTSRTYPNTAPEQFKDVYNLVLYNGNYLGLFLINKLFANRKDILIEDIGSGVGHLLVYLYRLGFNNFHIIEDFSQINKGSLDLMMNTFDIKYQLNNRELNPIVIHNSGVPDMSVFNIKPSIELFICYTNRTIENWAREYLPTKNFIYLGKDMDDFAFAYCREDKFEEFKTILKPYLLEG